MTANDFFNNPLILLAIVGIVVTVIAKIYGVTTKNKDENKRVEITELFFDCIPVIEEALNELAKLYGASKSEDEMITYAIDFLYKKLWEYTDWEEKYNNILTKDNIRKYIYPLFKKMYETKVVKLTKNIK